MRPHRCSCRPPSPVSPTVDIGLSDPGDRTAHGMRRNATETRSINRRGDEVGPYPRIGFELGPFEEGHHGPELVQHFYTMPIKPGRQLETVGRSRVDSTVASAGTTEIDPVGEVGGGPGGRASTVSAGVELGLVQFG